MPVNKDVCLNGIYSIKGKKRKANCRIILIVLTNWLDWEKALDPRILSFLKKTELIFEPFDASDLLEMLKLRSEKALRQERVDEAALKKATGVCVP